MQIKSKYPVLLIFLLCLIINSGSLFSANVYYGFVDVNVQTQEMTLWCWAASSQALILQRTGVFVAQSAIVEYVKGSVINASGMPHEIKMACDANGASVTYFWSIPNAPSISSIISWIDSNKCFIVLRNNHATVGFGYLIYYFSNFTTRWVAIDDPWYGKGKSWYSLENLQSGWSATVR
jgi:hypothetical protein